MKNLVRTLCACATLFYACQRPADSVAPLDSMSNSRKVAAKPTKCASPLTVKIKSSFKDFDRLFLFEAMYVGRNGRDSSLAGAVYQDLINGEELAFAQLANNKTIRVRLYENEQDKTKFVSSGTFASCSQNADFDLRSFKLSATPVPVTFQVKFPCTDVDNKKLPKEVAVEFRQTGTATWFPLTTLDQQDVKKNLLQTSSYRVIKGRTYDVRFSVFGIVFSQNATLINKDVLEIPVNTTLFCK